MEFRIAFLTTRRTHFIELLTPREDLATFHALSARALLGLTRWRATNDQGGIQVLINGLVTMCHTPLHRLPANLGPPAE